MLASRFAPKLGVNWWMSQIVHKLWMIYHDNTAKRLKMDAEIYK